MMEKLVRRARTALAVNPCSANPFYPIFLSFATRNCSEFLVLPLLPLSRSPASVPGAIFLSLAGPRLAS